MLQIMNIKIIFARKNPYIIFAQQITCTHFVSKKRGVPTCMFRGHLSYYLFKNLN